MSEQIRGLTFSKKFNFKIAEMYYAIDEEMERIIREHNEKNEERMSPETILHLHGSICIGVINAMSEKFISSEQSLYERATGDEDESKGGPGVN